LSPPSPYIYRLLNLDSFVLFSPRNHSHIHQRPHLQVPVQRSTYCSSCTSSNLWRSRNRSPSLHLGQIRRAQPQFSSPSSTATCPTSPTDPTCSATNPIAVCTQPCPIPPESACMAQWQPTSSGGSGTWIGEYSSRPSATGPPDSHSSSPESFGTGYI